MYGVTRTGRDCGKPFLTTQPSQKPAFIERAVTCGSWSRRIGGGRGRFGDEEIEEQTKTPETRT